MPFNWTKQDYDDNYVFHVDRHFNATVAHDPAQIGKLKLHYHKYFMQPIIAAMWSRLAPILSIASTEDVCVVGAGFGWGVDAFIAETGANTVGIDVSDYIFNELNNTEEVEIDAEITAVGLNPSSGRGAAIKASIYDGQLRVPSGVIVLQEDAQTNTSRQAIRSALGGWPSVVIFEDLISADTTDEEITQADNAAKLFAGDQRVIWIMRRWPNRSYQDVATLTGSEVISVSGGTHLIP